MPKKTINDYTFYKIVNINGDVDLCYVGSTVNMEQRVRAHKDNCKSPNSPKHHLKVYKTIREHGGWDEFKMIPIGYAEQLTLTEAHVIEEKYRVELCAELNSRVCHLTEEERKENKALYHREWSEINKEAIAAKKKVYDQVNKEAIAEQRKVYRQNNKEAIAERDKVYYEKYKEKYKEKISENKKVYYENNKEAIRAKITCECGCVICHGEKARHRKTKKHIDLMNNKNNIDVIYNE